MRDHRRGARHVAQGRDLADDVVLTASGDLNRTVRSIDQDVGLTLKNDVSGVAVVILVKQLIAGQKLQPFAGERQQLQFCRLDLGEQRDVAQDLHVFGQAHRVALLAEPSFVLLFSSCNTLASQFYVNWFTRSLATTNILNRRLGPAVTAEPLQTVGSDRPKMRV